MPKIRKGKTAKDRESGAKQRNADNKRMRADWRNSMDARGKTDPFPRSTCNGKRNRFVVTGKGNKAVYL